MNARLHWLLQFSVLALFTCVSVNRNGAQLVFTSHEPLVIDPKVLRDDEIWFMQKFENVSSLYSTIEFKGDSKTYDDRLSWKFGALPVVKPLFGGRDGDREDRV